MFHDVPLFWGIFWDPNLTVCKMPKKIIHRNDLMSKKDYSLKYGISRPTIDKKIDNGELVVERISGVDYIRLNFK